MTGSVQLKGQHGVAAIYFEQALVIFRIVSEGIESNRNLYYGPGKYLTRQCYQF